MATEGGPNIVYNGLVLYTDAANKNSYTGTGTNWADLTGTGNNGTLTNGPTFSGTNGGTIVFDGVDDYVDYGNNASVNPQYLTMGVWVNYNTFSTRPHIGKGGGSLGAYYLVIETDSRYVFYYTKTSSTWSALGNSTISTNTWYYFVLTYDGVGPKIYINGSLAASANNTGTLSTTDSNNLRLGGYGGNPGSPVSGKVGSFQIYNRALTATEVLQNYNAMKNRFGL